jgi:hypothetical protein
MAEDEEDSAGPGEVELDAQKSLRGRLEYQALKQASNKIIDHYHISKRNENSILMAWYLRNKKEKLLDELSGGNPDNITVDMEDKVAEKLKDDPILKLLEDTVCDDGLITGIFETRKGKSIIMSHKDVMSEVFFQKIAGMEKLEALLISMLDDDDLPTVPVLDEEEIRERHRREKLEDRLERRSEKRESRKPNKQKRRSEKTVHK